MASRYGNTSASRLVNTAAAAVKKNQVLQDSIQNYTYSMSARTQGDLQSYHAYLDSRIAQTQDPAEKLSFQKQKDSAFRNYVTAEIGRKSIDTLEGRGTDKNKYDSIVQLFYAAQNNGDDYLAQTLLQRADQLSIKMQQEQAAAASAAKSGAKTAATNSTNELLRRLDTVQQVFNTSLKTGRPVKDPVTGEIPKYKLDKNGDPILDANGHIQEDPNGKPLKITANNYALMTGQAMLTQEKILVNAINTGGDENGTLTNKLTALQNGAQFNEYTNPALVDAIKRGERPFETVVDAQGNRTVKSRTVLGADPLLDAKGQPVLDENGQPRIARLRYETGVSGGASKLSSGQAGNFVYERRAGKNASDPYSTYDTKIYYDDPSGVPYTIDPEKGNKLYIRKETNAAGKNLISLTPTDEKVGGSDLSAYAGAFKDSLPGRAAGKLASLLGGAVSANQASLGKLIPGAVGKGFSYTPTGQVLGGILNAAKNVFNNDAAQAAERQRQAEAQAAIQRANAQAAASLNAIPRAQANIPVQVNGNQVVGAKASVYAVPKAVVKAQTTAGSKFFLPASSGGKTYDQILKKVGL